MDITEPTASSSLSKKGRTAMLKPEKTIALSCIVLDGDLKTLAVGHDYGLEYELSGSVSVSVFSFIRCTKGSKR